MATTGEHVAGNGAGTRRRTGLVWTIILLAAVVGVLSSLTVWVKRQALDTDEWTKASTELLQNDQVRHALAVYVVDELYANADPAGQLEERLPADLSGLAEPLAGALRAPAVQAVDELLARPRIQQLWMEVNRVAHQQLLDILNGSPRANVSTSNGTVVLDLRSFIADVGTELGIGTELDDRLPADVGQVTVLQSDQLATAQDAVKAIKALSWLLFLLVFLLWALAMWLAEGWRRVALRGIGTSLLVVGLMLLVIRRAAGNYVVNALTTPGDVRDAGQSAWLLATSLLADIGWAAIFYGLVVVLGAWLVGPSGVATRARAGARPLVVERAGLAWTALSLVFLLLVWWGPTPAFRRAPGVLLLGVLLAVGFELFRRVVARELPAAISGPPETAPEPSVSVAEQRAPVDQ